MTAFEQAVLKTLAYFVLFEYPLTLVELQRWLYIGGDESVNPTIEELQQGIRASAILTQNVKEKGGFYIVSSVDIDHALANRQERYRITQSKMRRARMAAAVFKYFPYVRFVGVANRVGWGIAREGSDIDFFIIARAGRLWLTRLLVTGVSACFGLRPTATRTDNTFCLSFYMSDDVLDLGSVRYRADDIHFAYWLVQVFPLYNKDSLYEKMLAANQYWLRHFFNIPGLVSVPVQTPSRAHFLEKYARFWQKRVLDKQYRTRNPQPASAVLYNDRIIKLHWTDRRAAYYDEWSQQVKNICTTNG